LKGTVHYEVRDGVAVLTVDNPPVNPLSDGVRAGLFEGIANAEADTNVVGVVVTGKEELLLLGLIFLNLVEKVMATVFILSLKILNFVLSLW